MRGSGVETLVLDLGDALIGTGREAEIKSVVYAGAFKHMAYDAVALGDRDIRYMREGGHPRPFGDLTPTICANVVSTAGDKLVAGQGYVVRQLESGLRVGVIAVLGEQILDSKSQAALGIRVAPPAKALDACLPELRKKADVVVLLSHAGHEASVELAGIRGVDVVLAADSSSDARDGIEFVGRTPVMDVWTAGKHLGSLSLVIDEGGRVTTASGTHPALGAEIADDPSMQTLVAQHDKSLGEFLTAGWGQSPTDFGTGEPKPFVSASKCAQCHTREYNQWANTGHASAFEGLRRENHTSDPECAICHATGLASKGGFRSESTTPELRGVQCEACHGPGVRHVRSPDKGYGAVLRSKCIACHDPGHSPRFDLPSAMKRVSH